MLIKFEFIPFPENERVKRRKKTKVSWLKFADDKE